MARHLAQTITFSGLLIVVFALGLAHASSFRTYKPVVPSYSNDYPVQVYQPYYTQPQEPYYTQTEEPYYTQTQEPYYTQTQQPTYSQPPPTYVPSYGGGGGASNTEKAVYLQLHNAARAVVGVGPLSWDDRVAAFAQSWANQRINDCRLVHSNNDQFGENIFWGSGDYSAAFALQTWIDERKYYDYGSNSCGGGQDCGHYTQIVWRQSQRLGCARVKCNDGGVFVTCNYDPPGNYVGTRPY
ncbi:unnamed protein product [Amaranthus hypochondriacus]